MPCSLLYTSTKNMFTELICCICTINSMLDGYFLSSCCIHANGLGRMGSKLAAYLAKDVGQ